MAIKIKYDISLMKYMSLFEQITHAQVKDCFVDAHLNLLTFVVQPGQIGKAVGKKGSNVRLIENKLKRKIRVIEFHPEKINFIKNMIMPLRVDDAREEDGVVLLESKDVKTKSLLIGRSAQNLRNLEANVRRFFEVDEIKVV
jgi:transcription termination/antitermination protein NusA